MPRRKGAGHERVHVDGNDYQLGDGDIDDMGGLEAMKTDTISKLVTAKSEKEAIAKATYKFADFGYNMDIWPLKSVTCVSDRPDQEAYSKPINKMFIVYFGGK